MASVHKADCSCGFSKEVIVGGSMQNFTEDSRFPFYCQKCGLVSANIAHLIGLGWPASSSQKSSESHSPPICPTCGNENIDQYGVSPASITQNEGRIVLQAWDFKAFEKGNLCPACKQMTLVFHSPHILAD